MNVSLKKLTDALNRLQAQINALSGGGSGGVTSVNGETGTVVLTAGDVGAVASIVPGSGIGVDNTDPQNPVVSATGGGSSAPATTIYWDRYNAAADIALVVLEKYAGTSSAGSGGQVWGVIPKSSGKWYFETNCVKHPSSVSTGCGVSTSSETLSNFCGQSLQSWGTWARPSSDRSTFHNTVNANATTGAASAAGQSARIAVDIDAGKLWMSYFGSTTWIGGGDPATGTSPTYTFTGGTTILPACSPRSTGCLLKFVAEQEKANTTPSGFSYWPGRIEY